MAIKGKLSRVGNDWDFDVDVEILKEKRRHSNDARRFTIAMGVLGSIGLGVIGLGGFGIYASDFSIVGGFWTAAGPVFGTIIGYYFGKDGDDP